MDVFNFSYSPNFDSNPIARVPCYSVIDRIKILTRTVDEDNEVNLYNLFVEIVFEIFGHGSAKGWELDKLKTKSFSDHLVKEQLVKFNIFREPDAVFTFLCSNGYIFNLCYKLLSNGLDKFDFYFSHIPVEFRQAIVNSFQKSYYGLRFFYDIDSNVPIGLKLNPFEFYMFNFALFGLKMNSDNVLNLNMNESSVYRLLCLDYLNFFLPLKNSASMILPQLHFSTISPISIQKPCINSSKSLSLIKKDIESKDFWNDISQNCSMSEITWRSEVIAMFFADIWLNVNVPNVPSMDLTKIIRYFIKHLHLYSNSGKHLPMDNLKLILIGRHSKQIYQYLGYYMEKWPLNFSFRLLFDIWICFIQPWRYENINKQNMHITVTKHDMNEKWKTFIVKNLLCYTKLFYLAVKRFNCIDICSPKYSVMIYKMLKVYTFPYLLNLILENEEIYQSTQYERTNYNAMLSDCILEAENPLFKYEPMFSEDRNYDYKLFYKKLQMSLDRVNFEINRFQEEKLESYKSSMFNSILKHRKSTYSNYSLSEWEEIDKNLKSSLTFMDNIFSIAGMTHINDIMDLSTSSVSSTFDNNNAYSSKNNSPFKYFDNKTVNMSSRIIHEKEYEIDPDYKGPLYHENEILVHVSKLLRTFVEHYGNSYILKYSSENTVLAGVLRQTLIRAPLKIYSYEFRNNSGKRVRTPKILQPTISFRWMASYFTLTWILFLMMIILTINNTGLWIFLMLVVCIIYFCIKYILGYAQPFVWEDTLR